MSIIFKKNVQTDVFPDDGDQIYLIHGFCLKIYNLLGKWYLK